MKIQRNNMWNNENNDYVWTNHYLTAAILGCCLSVITHVYFHDTLSLNGKGWA